MGKNWTLVVGKRQVSYLGAEERDLQTLGDFTSEGHILVGYKGGPT